MLMRNFTERVWNPDRQGAVWLFLIGAFSLTQMRLGAKIGISEVVCCLVGPFLFLKNLPVYRRDGVLLFFNLLIFWMLGALFSDFYNGSFFEQVIRGFSVPFTLFSVSVCVYHLLRRNPLNLKWILVGIAVSSVVSIFVFQRGSAGDLAAEGDTVAAVEKVVGYKLFWANMIRTWLTLPIQCWYLSVPAVFIYPVLMVVVVVNMFAGGRSLFAVSVLTVLLIFLGGKTERTIHAVRRRIPLLVVGVLCLVALIKGAYSYAAQHGYLNEAETKKYQMQTVRGTDFLSLLMSGRGDFFIGLMAALDRPLVGHGSQAMDSYGYERDFVVKYGTDEEIAQFVAAERAGYFRNIKGHSHIITYWMWHGIAGLLFWAYLLCVVVQTVWRRLGFIPEWFGYLAITIPMFLWDFFFSPLGMRVTESVFYCALLVLLRIDRLRKGGVR